MALLTVLFYILTIYQTCYLFHNHILQSHLLDIWSHGIYCVLRRFEHTKYTQNFQKYKDWIYYKFEFYIIDDLNNIIYIVQK